VAWITFAAIAVPAFGILVWVILDDSLVRVAKSGANAAESGKAGDQADAYVLTTLLLAAALFFSGLTTSFRVRLARVMLLGAASLTIAYAASRPIDLPIA
jgi:hypothetical protein